MERDEVLRILSPGIGSGAADSDAESCGSGSGLFFRISSSYSLRLASESVMAEALLASSEMPPSTQEHFRHNSTNDHRHTAP